MALIMLRPAERWRESVPCRIAPVTGRSFHSSPVATATHPVKTYAGAVTSLITKPRICMASSAYLYCLVPIPAIFKSWTSHRLYESYFQAEPEILVPLDSAEGSPGKNLSNWLRSCPHHPKRTLASTPAQISRRNEGRNGMNADFVKGGALTS